MKRLAIAIAILIILSGLYIIHDRVYYGDEVEYLSPLDLEVIKLRYDKFGDGHFHAKRKNNRKHGGIDILSDTGTPVRAAKSGWAIAEFDKDGFGNYVKIYHGSGVVSYYGHMEGASMRWIDKVKQGDTIGWVGCTGNARSKGMKPHLHFEIRKNGLAVDPMELLAREE